MKMKREFVFKFVAVLLFSLTLRIGEARDPLKCWDRVDSRDYVGRRNWTYKGKTCQAWSAQSPHSHSNNKDELFPEDASVAKAKNYCRDPDKEGKPWCYTTDPETRWQYCDVPICNLDCWTGTGSRFYYGTISVTKNGRQCQEWTEQTPHQHTRNKDEQFPLDGSIVVAKNYCRDPDKEGAPWCYTTDPHVRWEYCDIPSC